jgi:hypothetical protein
VKKFLILVAAATSLGACSSIIEGTSQEILVNTNPAGANCKFEREGVVIATIPATPAAATIRKTKHDIVISCDKPGYQSATYMNKSDVAGATVGNILLGGGIGWAIDSAAGADNKYASPVNITLVPGMAGTVVAPASPATPAFPAAPASPGTTASPGLKMQPVGT